MPSIVQELDKLIAQAGGTPSGSGLSINEKLKQLNGLIGGTPANIFTYKGSVATADLLPTSGQSVGDVYNIISESDYGPAGTNVAWAGEEWDALGGSSSGSASEGLFYIKVDRDTRGNYTLLSDIDDVAKEIVKAQPMLAAILYFTPSSDSASRKATLFTLGSYMKYNHFVYLTFCTLDDVQPQGSSDVSSTFGCESFVMEFIFPDATFTGTPTVKITRRFRGSITAVGPSAIKPPVQIAALFYKWNDQSDVYDMTRKELVGPYRLHDWRVFPYGNDAGTTRIDELLEDFYNNNIYVIDYTDSRDSSFDYTDPTNYLYASSAEAGSGQFYDLISADAAKYKPLGVVKKLVSVGYSDNGDGYDQKCDIVLEYFDSTQSKMVYDTVRIEFTDYATL